MEIVMNDSYSNDKTNKLKYIGYVRKSTEDEEKQVLSKGAQLDKIKERFSELNIVDFLDESMSAFEPYKRPVFQSILDRIDKGEIDGIIAWHPDRLSRNAIDAANISHRITKGIIKDLRFASYNFDSSPEGIMMLQMTMSQSQYFSAKLSKDIRRGNERKRQLGGLTGNAHPGYLNERIKKTVYKDPVRFPVLRRAFDLFLTGEYSVPDVLNIMTNDWGYRTLERTHSGGGPLSRTSLYNIFRNVRYTGWVPDPYSGTLYKADYPAMITEEEYDKVQILLGRKGLPRLASRKQFALRGFIRCGDCDCTITAQSKKKQLTNGKVNVHTYYHCTGKRAGCSQKSIYVKEDVLYDELTSLLDQYELAPEMNEWAMDALRELSDKEVEDRNSVQSMQNKTIEATQAQLDTLLDMATRRIISDDEFKDKAIKLKQELKSLQAEQADTAYRVKNWYEFILDTFEKLTNANEKFINGELSDRKEILLAIGKNPVLLDGKLHITSNEWLIPVANNAKRIRAELEKVRTKPERIQKASFEALRTEWCRV